MNLRPKSGNMNGQVRASDLCFAGLEQEVR